MVREHERAVSRRLGRPAAGRRPWWVSHPAQPVGGPLAEWVAIGHRTVVAVSGDLDRVPSGQLEGFLAQQPLAGCAVLDIDLAGVSSIGSTGLSVLLAVRRWALQRGIELRIRGTQPSVWRAFEVTGLAVVFAPASDRGAPSLQDLVLF